MLGNDKDFLATARLLQARSARPQPSTVADRLLDLAGRRPAGVPEPPGQRVRPGAAPAGYRISRAGGHGVSLPGGRHPLAGRPLPRLRRAGPGHGLRRAAWHRRAKRLADALRRRRHGPRRHPGLRRSTTTAPPRSASRRRASRARPQVIATAQAVAGVDAGTRRLRRGARHRHAARRSDRGRGADAGVPSTRRRARGSARIGSVKAQHRASGRGRRRRRPDQDRAGARSTARCRRACTSKRRTREIDFADSPFFVNAALRPWPGGRAPRRAGRQLVRHRRHQRPRRRSRSRALRRRRPEPRPWQLLPLSARTPTALDAATATSRGHLRQDPDGATSPTSPTRCRWAARALRPSRALVVASRAMTAPVPPAPRARDASTAMSAGRAGPRRSCFLFPGQGAQHLGMARGLYGTSRSSGPRRRLRASCCSRTCGLDLARARSARRHRRRGGGAAGSRRPRSPSRRSSRSRTRWRGCWLSWGVRPAAMVGHSIGEIRRGLPRRACSRSTTRCAWSPRAGG